MAVIKQAQVCCSQVGSAARPLEQAERVPVGRRVCDDPPVKARALVFDLFGDYLRYRGGQVRLRGLIGLMDCFGVPATTVRVLAGRMRKEGWLASSRDGRETIYQLTDAAWRLLDEGRSRIFERVTVPWDGWWHVVLYSVPESERGLREQLRKKLSWHGFGPLAPSVWLSPHDRVRPLRADLAELAPIRLDVFRSRSEGRGCDRDISARAWDLDGLNRDYAALLATYRPRLERYRRGEPRGRDALVERMRLVQDYRRFPFRDPDLPAELLPDGWLGRTAHEVFLEAHRLLRPRAQGWVDGLLHGESQRSSIM